MTRILATATALPPHLLPRALYRDLVAQVFPHRESRTAQTVADHGCVEQRHLAIPPEEAMRPRPLGETSRRYAELTIALSESAAQQALDRAGVAPTEIDLIVTTSCTGLMIPSVDAFLVERMGLRRDCVRLPITELGCAAGAAALGRAREHLLAHPRHLVLVVACELASLTFQPGDPSQTNAVATALFGDGAAACVLGASDRARRPGPRLVAHRTHLFPRSHHLMGFRLESSGLHILLDREVPTALAGRVRPLVDEVLAREGLTVDDLRFAVVHPGGRRILEDVGRDLGIAPLLQPSWTVLGRVGNLSSATVLFVLDELLRTATAAPPPAGAPGLLLAFGPGFSAEVGVLRWEA
jgi:alkylresorcinol/alkylpyrone synthase